MGRGKQHDDNAVLDEGQHWRESQDAPQAIYLENAQVSSYVTLTNARTHGRARARVCTHAHTNTHTLIQIQTHKQDN